jgi:hypothetical protein
VVPGGRPEGFALLPGLNDVWFFLVAMIFVPATSGKVLSVRLLIKPVG